MAEKTCSTCGAKAVTIVEFPCPDCGEKITRCFHCRSMNNPYECKCGFKGP
jgi:Zn-ribbon RNA-binding protein